MPEFIRIGGVPRRMRSAAIAGAWGVPMSTHLKPEVASHEMRVTETAHWLDRQNLANPIVRLRHTLMRKVELVTCVSFTARTPSTEQHDPVAAPLVSL